MRIRVIPRHVLRHVGQRRAQHAIWVDGTRVTRDQWRAATRAGLVVQEPCAGTRCEACRRARNRAAAELRSYRRELGLCLTCGAAVARSKVQGNPERGGKRVRKPAAYCAQHLAYYAARQRGV